MKRRSFAAFAAISLLLAACGDDSDEPSGATDPAADATTAPSEAPSGTDAPAADGAEIVISGFAFSEGITVAAGTTVVVRNDDGSTHTLTADDGSFDTGSIDAGSTGEITLAAAGTFTFHCEVHPSMTGSITVTG